MYPKDAPGPLREEDLLHGPFEPTNEAYAIAKVAVQRLGRYISDEDSRFQYKTLIPCNLYGRYDSFDSSRSHLAAAVVRKLHTAKAEGRRTVDIWGNGTARREFLYAADLAEAILAALERFSTLPAIMNVGSGTDHTVAEYYDVAAEVVGYDGSFTFDLSKPVGMQRKLMDSSLARAWGWQARTSLRDGLVAAYAYYVSTLAETPAGEAAATESGRPGALPGVPTPT
jgi:GDP-L-fucose synthase